MIFPGLLTTGSRTKELALWHGMHTGCEEEAILLASQMAVMELIEKRNEGVTDDA